MAAGNDSLYEQLSVRFGDAMLAEQKTADNIPTFWVAGDRLIDVVSHLKTKIDHPFRTLYDLTALDERVRTRRTDQPASTFTLVYQLLSYERNQDVRLKVPLSADFPSVPSVIGVWPAADWYEREVWDMFGVQFEGHPDLRRILMPEGWIGHPLRKEHPARGTEMARFYESENKELYEEELFQFKPEEWGLADGGGEDGYMVLNMGPHHPGTHGLLRLVLQLDGEEIRRIAPQIGFHHRGAEKMGERQSWHTYIPYTDRIDYLAGFLNEFPYVLAAETLAGLKAPERAQMIRVMLAELFRIASHLVFYGTFAQDLGQISPVFYAFNDRERVFGIIEAICGGRMHPMWFRIGGVAQDLPEGWDSLVRDFVRYFPKRLDEFRHLVLDNRIFKARTKGVGVYGLDQAIEWGVTGPNLRACGLDWDLRKKRPYSGYEQFEFQVPTTTDGDSFSRAVVRVEEMRQSLRIVEQCLNNMPAGPYKSHDPIAAPPFKDRTMRDIETLIDHFLGVSWGPVIPPGEAAFGAEAAKGNMTYYLISDGDTVSYRTRIRTPSFPHIQTVPWLAKGLMIPDLIAILGSIDYVMGDVDR
jgi:NADH-quinone oxidoreductase subunit C/D